MHKNKQSKPLNIIFMGTPEFAQESLKKVLCSRHNVLSVYTKPPQPKNRGQKVHISPVHSCAQQHNIPVFTPHTLRDNDIQHEFIRQNADLAIVAAYGLILPPPILNAPKYGCINIHASLLPRWRGAAPIQRAILSGDQKTGITLMQMDEGLDTGDILAMKEIAINDDTTTPSLYTGLTQLASSMIVELLDNLHDLQKIPQNNASATYADKLAKEEATISWDNPAMVISRQVRALNPWPGSTTLWNGKPIKILQLSLTDRPYVTEKPGAIQIINHSLQVACNDKWITIEKLQIPGKQKYSAFDFINGYDLDSTAKFGI